MKESKQNITTATPQKNGVFFKKSTDNGFFHSDQSNSFFSGAGNTGIQAKLTIGQPNDMYEQEADKMADHTVQRLSQPDTIQKKSRPPAIQKCADCDRKEKVPKKADSDSAGTAPLESSLQSSQGSGSPLPSPVT